MLKTYLRSLLCLASLLACAPAAHANNPVLTLLGLNPSGGDNTAFVDLVQVYSGTTGTTVVTGAVANGSFETSDALANTTYGYNPTGASWTFDTNSGIAANGSAFTPTVAAPGGTRVAFIQGASSIQQQLVLTPGTYRLTFRVSQRNCCSGTNNQKLSIRLDGVEIGTNQTTNTTGYDTFVSAAFTVTALSITSVSPTANTVAFNRTASLGVTFDRPVTSASAATISVFSAQRGGKRLMGTSVSGNTATVASSTYFRVGEMVNVVVPRTVVSSSNGEPTSNPQVYQFTTDVVASTGVFGGTLNPTAGANAANVAAGDLNDDGKLDLVTADYGNGNGTTVSVLRNTGTNTAPSFAARQTFTSGTGPYGLALGDVDNDGRLDILVGSSGTTVGVLRNTTAAGATTFSFATRVDYTVGSIPYGVALSDVDGDGRLDLLASNYSSGTVSVLLNTGTTTGTVSFAAKVDYPVGTNPYSVVAADVNGDGKLDLLTANNSTTTVSVLRNTGTVVGTPSFAAKADFTVGASPINLAVNDIDGDGRLDVATSNLGATGTGTTVSVLRNTTTAGATTLSFAAKVDYTVGTGPVGIAIGDINGDGKLDVVTSNYGASNETGVGNTVSVLRNTSTSGTLGFATKVDYAVGSGANDVKLADIDGDGDLDILTANQDASTTSVRLNANTGPQVPLPVSLTAFTAVARQADAVLTWSTAQETNNAGFLVERSVNGIDFVQAGTIAGHGSTPLAHTYTFTDPQAARLATTLYYQLRQIDLDGTATFSPVRPVLFAQVEVPALSIFPNPAHGYATAIVPALAGPASVELTLHDVLGQVVRKYAPGQAADLQAELDLTGLPKGIYVLQLWDGATTTRRQLTLE